MHGHTVVTVLYRWRYTHKNVDGAIRRTSYSPPAMARRANGSSSSQSPIILRASESAPSPKGVHRDGEATLSTPAVLHPSSSRPKPPFSLYLTWWRRGSPSVNTSSSEKRVNINISARWALRLVVRCWLSVLNNAQRCDATRWRGGGGTRGARGRARGRRREGSMWHTSEAPQRCQYLAPTKSHITIHIIFSTAGTLQCLCGA